MESMQSIELVKFYDETTVKMLEQLNRSLELLQVTKSLDVQPVGVSQLREYTEARVLESIVAICQPVVGFREEINKA